MNLEKNNFWTPLLALDRLNSWLRADHPFCCPLRSALRGTIYWTKTQAILDASKRWHIGMRRVMVKKECHTCSGTGLWVPWNYDPPDEEYSSREGGEPCRRCGGTGTATLKFIETEIGPIRWHTPADKWYMSSLDVYVPFPSFAHDGEKHYELSNGWEPLQKGRPMKPAEVERDFLIILEAYPHHVCFHLDYDHHAGIERRWMNPDMSKARAWTRNLFHPEDT